MKFQLPRLRLFGLTLAAAVVFGSLLAGNAFALSVSPTGKLFTVQSGSMKWTDTNQNTYDCTGGGGGGGTGRFNPGSGTNGTITMFFTGCGYNSFGQRHSCTTAGQATGTIRTSALPFDLIWLDTAQTKFGYRLKPPAGSSVVATFSCVNGQNSWTGTGLIGRITSPALNVSSKQFTLEFAEVSPGVQEYRTSPTEPFPYNVFAYKLQYNSGGPDMAIDATESGTWSEPVSFLP